jgi:NADPH-dependent 2,4-dienoyl-CoA reductase/sulfur reductase-like enzyme
LKGVYTLRDFKDNQKIKNAALKAKKIVIVGGGFIGMEMANTLHQINSKAEITVVDSNSTPFQKILGKEVGKILQR